VKGKLVRLGFWKSASGSTLLSFIPCCTVLLTVARNHFLKSVLNSFGSTPSSSVSGTVPFQSSYSGHVQKTSDSIAGPGRPKARYNRSIIVMLIGFKVVLTSPHWIQINLMLVGV
jgi:hypothetical protein